MTQVSQQFGPSKQIMDKATVRLKVLKSACFSRCAVKVVLVLRCFCFSEKLGQMNQTVQ